MSYIYLLDNGLINKGSHSFNLATELRKAVYALRHSIIVYGCAQAEDDISVELGAIRHFKSSIYDVIETGGGIRELETCLKLNERYFDDLCQLESRIWTTDSLIIIPSITQNEVLGLSRFLSQNEISPGTKIVCQLMFPLTWTSWGSKSIFAGNFFEAAFHKIRHMFNRNVFFASENESVGDQYRATYNIDVNKFPMPFGLDDYNKYDKKSRNIRLGFFGYSKTEKGFHLLPDAIESVLMSTRDVEFLIQIQHAGWEKEILDAESRIYSFLNTTIVKGAVHNDMYRALLSSVDIILLPYDSEKYDNRGSAVLVEAVSLGLPIVASDNTWAAAMIKSHLAAGVIMRDYTSKSLAESIMSISENYPALSSESEIISQEFKRDNSGSAYIRAAIGLSRWHDSTNLPALLTEYNNEAPSLMSGERAQFGINQRGNEIILNDDLHFGEDYLLWNQDDDLTMKFSSEEISDTVVLYFQLKSETHLALTQKIQMYFNGIYISTLCGSDSNSGEYKISIPGSLWNQSKYKQIVLRPLEYYRVDRDRRILSFYITSFYFDIRKTSIYPSYDGKPVHVYGDKIHDMLLLAGGWASPEQGWVWAIDEYSHLKFFYTGHGSNLKLIIDVWPPENETDRTQSIEIELNGTIIAQIEICQRDKISVPIPNFAATHAVPISMSFKSKRYFDMNPYGDVRKLRFALGSLEIRGEEKPH